MSKEQHFIVSVTKLSVIKQISGSNWDFLETLKNKMVNCPVKTTAK